MLALLGASQNLPFTVSLAVMLVIFVVELVALLIGGGISESLDAMLPDMELEVGLENTASSFTRLLGWLHVGKVPLLMLLIVFLTAFGLIGLVLQGIAHNLVGSFMPAWLASIPAFAASLPVVRTGGAVLAKIMPNDETDAVSSSTFIGRVATVTLGEATAGSSAEAKVTDEHGYTHYIMVEPDSEGVSFPQGSQVLLTEEHGAVFKGIRSDSDGLKEE